MKDINGVELKVGDIVEIVKPEGDFFRAGDRAKIIHVQENSCHADFTLNKTYFLDGMWGIGGGTAQSTCKIINPMEGYDTGPINYSGCHPVIAEALQQNLMIKCKVWDAESAGETSYIYRYNENTEWPYIDTTGTTWKNAEPIKSAPDKINRGDKGWMSRENFNQAHTKWLDTVAVLDGDYPWEYRGSTLFGRTDNRVVDIPIRKRCGFCDTFNCPTCPLNPRYCDVDRTGNPFVDTQSALSAGDGEAALISAKTMLNAIGDHGRKLGYIDAKS